MNTTDFVRELRRQELERLKRDIASESLLPCWEFQARLQISAVAFAAALESGRMFVLTGPTGEDFCPAFFSDSNFDRSSLEQVCVALGHLSGPIKWSFFTTPRISTDGTPLQALARGKVETVLAAAQAFAEA